MDWTLGFVGAGVMAEVMISGLVGEGVLPPERIIASNRRPARSQELRQRHGVRTTRSNLEVASASDLLVLSVKPQSLGQVLPELRGGVPPRCLVLSIIAGAPLAVLARGLEHQRVARCMPNLPCRVRQGMTVWTAPADTSDSDLERVRTILGVMGQEIQVDDERHVDMATAVNGTGPAIVAHFVKAFVEAATYIGESRSVAQETVLATLLGTAEMIRVEGEGGIHVAQLIDQVTSPGGTTSRALQVLKNGRFSAVLTDAIDAAYQRTVELGAALEAPDAEE